MSLFRVSYTPEIETAHVVIIEAPTADDAVAQVYPDADHTQPIHVEGIEVLGEWSPVAGGGDPGPERRPAAARCRSGLGPRRPS